MKTADTKLNRVVLFSELINEGASSEHIPKKKSNPYCVELEINNIQQINDWYKKE